MEVPWLRWPELVNWRGRQDGNGSGNGDGDGDKVLLILFLLLSIDRFFLSLEFSAGTDQLF